MERFAVKCILALLSALRPDLSPVRVEGWIAAGGPIVIFALLFACGLGLPLPEDIPLMAGGYLVAIGKMHLIAVAILAWCGIVGGDCMLYQMGKKYGLNITRVPFVGKHVTPERIIKAERLFEKWGIWVVAVGRLVAGVRGAMVVAAGAIRFNFVKFIIADGLAALVSGGAFVAIGYFLGKQLGDFDQAVHKARPYLFWIITSIVAAAILFILYQWWSRRGHEGVTDVALTKAVEVAEKRPISVSDRAGS